MSNQKIQAELVKIQGYTDLIDDSVLAISNELGTTEPTISFGTPVRFGKILSSAVANIFTGYSAWEYLSNGKIRMWYLWQNILQGNVKQNFFLSCVSETGLSGRWHGINCESGVGVSNPNQGYGGTSVVKFKGSYYHVYNTAHQNLKVRKRFFKSPNGYQWTEYSTAVDQWAGEDHTLFVINAGKPDEELIMLLRPHMPGFGGDPLRHSGIMRSFDGVNWSPHQRLFTSTNPDRQYYMHSACQVGDMYYSILNVFGKSNETVSMEVWISDDLTNWSLKESIPMPANVKQQYGGVSYNPAKKEINILALECENDHEGNGNPANRFYLALYKTNVFGI